VGFISFSYTPVFFLNDEAVPAGVGGWAGTCFSILLIILVGYTGYWLYLRGCGVPDWDLTLQKGLMPQPRGLAPEVYGYVPFLNWYSGAYRYFFTKRLHSEDGLKCLINLKSDGHNPRD
jgi:hypothetical protein